MKNAEYTIPVRINPRSEDWSTCDEFVTAVVEAVRRVPAFADGHLPVSVILPMVCFTRARFTPSGYGDTRSVLEVAAHHAAKWNPLATVVSLGSEGEFAEAVAWGERLLGLLSGVPAGHVSQ